MNYYRYLILLEPHMVGHAATLDEAHQKILNRPGRKQNGLRLDRYRVVDQWNEPGAVYDERMSKWRDFSAFELARIEHPDYRHTVDNDGNLAIYRRDAIAYCEGI